jgi:hypothetical protein
MTTKERLHKLVDEPREADEDAGAAEALAAYNRGEAAQRGHSEAQPGPMALTGW